MLLEVMKGASVVLDSFPFGGGVTSLQTFAVGTPIVTMPSDMLAGRLTLAMYRSMGMESNSGVVASSIEGYVDAVRANAFPGGGRYAAGAARAVQRPAALPRRRQRRPTLGAYAAGLARSGESPGSSQHC